MIQNKHTLYAFASALTLAACNVENTPPTLSFADVNITATALQTQTVNAVTGDHEGDSVVLSLQGAPGWVSIGSGNSILLNPTNPEAGTHTVTVIASDHSDSVSKDLTIEVVTNNPLTALPDYRSRALADEVFYFVMTDRFDDGDSANNEGDVSDPLSSGGYDKTDNGYYHGGDLQGLTNQLSYIEDLGATAIWLTPILKNKAMQGNSAGYHGYWTLDFTSIDPHLGGDEGLIEFIDAAHARNIKVFFDIIVNHTADVIKFDECHNADGSLLVTLETCEYISLAEKAAGDGYTPFIPVGEEAAKIPAWLNNSDYYHNQGESTWAGENSLYGDFVGLDDIDTDNPEVVTLLTEVFQELVYKFKPDGFRVDTVKHVDDEFWRQFTPDVMTYAQAEDTDGLGTDGAGIAHFTLFGEVYSADANVLSHYTTSAKIPSVLDFGFQAAITSTILSQGVFADDSDGNSTHPLTLLFNTDDKFSDQDSDANDLINFVGNHDMGRFAYFLGDFLDWEDTALGMVDIAHAAMFFSRGAPVIYYGAEQGFVGTGGDKAARQDMMPSEVASYNATDVLGTDNTTADANFDISHALYLKWREYSEVLRNHENLRSGSQHIRTTSTSNTYALSRFNRATSEEYLVLFNFNKDRRKTVIVPALAASYQPVYGVDSAINAVDNELSVSVPALGVVILKATAIVDSPAPNIASVTAPDADSYVAGAVSVEVDITGADLLELPTYQVTLEYSLNSGTDWLFASRDNDYPYALDLNTVDISNGAAIQLRVNVDNVTGDSDTQLVGDYTVDERLPTVSIDYEGASAGKFLAVTYSSGKQEIIDASGIATFEWSENSDAMLMFFTPGADGAIDVDQPRWVEQNNVMALATENPSSLALEASIFLNHAGEIASVDNDSGSSAALLNQAGASSIGTVFIRGSLNNWQTTATTFANGTYHAAPTLNSGDIEFKFADSTWNVLNVGGPMSESGLVNAGNPGNLLFTAQASGVHDFYLFVADIDNNGSANELLHLINPR